MEPEPSVEFSFDPVGMIGKLARHEFWHNQVGGARSHRDQLPELAGDLDLPWRHPWLFAIGVATEQIEEVAGVGADNRRGPPDDLGDGGSNGGHAADTSSAYRDSRRPPGLQAVAGKTSLVGGRCAALVQADRRA
jgi:hypothetical protein